MSLFNVERRSLARFASAVVPAFDPAPHAKLTIRYLERLLSGQIRKLAIIMPPRHGKSTLGNILFPSYALGRNPRETIITVSYGADLAEGFGRRVRNFIGDIAFQEIFPDCKLSPDSQAAYRFETTLGGEFTATGRGGPVTGRGASLLILDDLLKDQMEANSEAICRSAIEWLQSVAFSRLTPNGRVLAIGTRWSERDPIGWLLAQAGWTVLHLPAFAQENDPLGRSPGEALWPSHYPVEALEQIRTDVGPRVFQCLYQGNVAAAEGTLFKRDWFRHYQRPPEKFTKIIQSWDTSFKTGHTNDYSVCATIGETSTGFYLLSLLRAKLEFPQLKAAVQELAEQWRPSEILIEDKASGQSLIQELKLSTSYPVIAVKVDRDKESRAAATTGYFEAGRVQFPEGAPWLADLEDELASFPGALHDDCVDALSQAFNRLREGRGIFGVLDWFRAKKEQFGDRLEKWVAPAPKEPRPAPVVSGHAQQPAKPPGPKTEEPRTCPECRSRCTVRLGQQYPSGRWHCNQCGVEFDDLGTVLSRPAPSGRFCECEHPLIVQIGNERRCNQCGRQSRPATGGFGVSRKQYAEGVGRTARKSRW